MCEQRVELVAEPTTPTAEDLAGQHVAIERDRLAERDAEVLERDALKVRGVQATQSGGVRTIRAGQSEPVEVDVDEGQASLIHGKRSSGQSDGVERRSTKPIGTRTSSIR